jgi:putative endonuclease
VAKEFFYKEDNVLKKYVYCIRGCPTAYKQEQIGSEIVQVANSSGYICKDCIKSLDIDQEAIRQPQNYHHISKPASSTPKNEFEDIENQTDLVEELEGSEEIEEVSEQSEEKKQLENKEQIENKKEQHKQKEEEQEEIIEEKETFFAYVLKCCDGTLYYGATTTSIDKAVKMHNKGSGSQYTKARRPVTLLESREANNLDEAKKMKSELQTKYENTDRPSFMIDIN